MGKFFEKALGIRPDEQPLVAGFFFLFVVIGMFYTVGVAVGDTLFLANLSPEEIPALYPWVYVGIAAGTLGWAVVHHRLQSQVSRFGYIVGTQLVGGEAAARAALRFLQEAFARPRFAILPVRELAENSHVAEIKGNAPAFVPYMGNLLLLRHFFGRHECPDITVSM